MIKAEAELELFTMVLPRLDNILRPAGPPHKERREPTQRARVIALDWAIEVPCSAAMDASLDKILCRGLSYESEIGFHACELKIAQRIGVDLIAWVSRIPVAEQEQERAIRFDYYEANKAIKRLCAAGGVRLLETITERIAAELLHHFDIHAIEVTVTKYPLDMPNAESVAYVCYRERNRS